MKSDMTPLNRTHTWKELRQILSDAPQFSNLDIHFANFIANLSETDSPFVPLAAALVSSKTGEGNVCLNLKEYADRNLPDEPDQRSNEYLTCPSFAQWTDLLLQSKVVGRDKRNTPLVLHHGGRLYLRRYWEYQNTITGFIQERAAAPAPDTDYTRLAKDIRKIFPSQSSDKTDWQKIGAMMAVTRLFLVVSGGPGTGKTSTVAKMLALLNTYLGSQKKLRLALAAPTGKAAYRLQEAITSTELLPDEMELPPATTLHRLLGAIQHSPYFRHNSENHLAADVVIIDEASMVDLPLMAKLMQAVPLSARLILLGDRHQLASVQPGSVLGDICPPENLNCYSDFFNRQIFETSGEVLAASTEYPPKKPVANLQDSFVELLDNYRFSDDSTIAKLSKAVKEGDGDGAIDLLLSDRTGQVTWSEIPTPTELEKKLQSWSGFPRYVSMLHTLNPDKCFAVLDNHRILCGLRRGPNGMQRINGVLAHLLASRYDPSKKKYLLHRNPDSFLAGQPVMVTRNDYSLQLYNGDVGIILPDPKRDESLRVFFKEESGTMKNIGLELLPAHEPVFAMTVHKSQGSEFDRVLLILQDQDSPLLTRELLYTAITRAREQIEIWGCKNIFCKAVKRQITRTSGLKEALWGDIV